MNTNSAILRFCDELSIECQRRLLSLKNTDIDPTLTHLSTVSKLIRTGGTIQIYNGITHLSNSLQILNVMELSSTCLLYVLIPITLLLWVPTLESLSRLIGAWSISPVTLMCFAYINMAMIPPVYMAIMFLVPIRMNIQRYKLVRLLGEFRVEIQSKEYNPYLLSEHIDLTVELCGRLKQ